MLITGDERPLSIYWFVYCSAIHCVIVHGKALFALTLYGGPVTATEVALAENDVHPRMWAKNAGTGPFLFPADLLTVT
jgi:hypothetical protein